MSIEKSLLHPETEKTDLSNAVQHKAETFSTFIEGCLLMEDIIRSSRESIEVMLPHLKKWKCFLEKESQQQPSLGAGYLPGNYIDCTPWNLMRVENTDKLQYFDGEWVYGERVSVSFILLRGLFSIYQWLYRRTYIELNVILPNFTLRGFCDYISTKLDTTITESQWNEALKQEWFFQKTTNFKFTDSFQQYKQKMGVINPPFYSNNWNQYYSNESSPLFEYLDKVSHNHHRLWHKINVVNNRLDDGEAQIKALLAEIQHIQASRIWAIRNTLSKIKKNILSKQNSILITRIKSYISRCTEIQKKVGWKLFIKKIPGALLRRISQMKFRPFYYFSKQLFLGKWIYSKSNIPVSNNMHYRLCELITVQLILD